jgi:hypothetical protein
MCINVYMDFCAQRTIYEQKVCSAESRIALCRILLYMEHLSSIPWYEFIHEWLFIHRC